MSPVVKQIGVTRRQAELIDWLKHPTGLPDHPAINPRDAMFTAREIVERSGLYTNRRACLADLNVLLKKFVVGRWGNRWRYIGGWSL